MEKREFCQLNEEDKIGLILLHGKLMARNTDEVVRMFLYQLYNFYVCLCYSTDEQEQLEEISVFNDVQDIISRFRDFATETDPACRIRKVPDLSELRFQQEVE